MHSGLRNRVRQCSRCKHYIGFIIECKEDNTFFMLLLTTNPAQVLFRVIYNLDDRIKMLEDHMLEYPCLIEKVDQAEEDAEELLAQEKQEATETSEIKVFGWSEGENTPLIRITFIRIYKKTYDGQLLGIHWEGFTGLEGELNKEFFAESRRIMGTK